MTHVHNGQRFTLDSKGITTMPAKRLTRKMEQAILREQSYLRCRYNGNLIDYRPETGYATAGQWSWERIDRRKAYVLQATPETIDQLRSAANKVVWVYDTVYQTLIGVMTLDSVTFDDPFVRGKAFHRGRMTPFAIHKNDCCFL